MNRIVKAAAVALVFSFVLGVVGGNVSARTNAQAEWRLVGWNDLGMHCMDASYDVFAILPPYNNIHAQLIDTSGGLVTDASGLAVTYEAVAGTSGTINSTSVGKTDFWQRSRQLFGVDLEPDTGLAGNAMPGAANVPQPMHFDTGSDSFVADGVPITPYDDPISGSSEPRGAGNPYPLTRLVARDGGGAILASTDVVLPVSDEMDCVACHGSGGETEARPPSGWVNDPDSNRDYRLNVLGLHDRHLGEPVYDASLVAAGYEGGLYASVVVSDTAVLCASCHASNALGTTGVANVPPLTQGVHALHAKVNDPVVGGTLEDADNRGACYRCHPGESTRCLRGAMGDAVGTDGSYAIQCQDCHGSMSAVGAASREGWLDEPTCQSCHTGTAVDNSGSLRYTSVFDGLGSVRQATDPRFASNPDTPAPGLSLYRLSSGHGGLQCAACHGSPHAEAPSSHADDNVQAIAAQGHAGVLAECEACHDPVPQTDDGGPHGLHPLGQDWIEGHKDPAEDNPETCRDCHGADYRGTVLSRALGDRTLSAFGTQNFWQGFQIGCYTCHAGPESDDRNPNRAPVVQDAAASTPKDQVLTLALIASDADGDPLTLRIVSQPFEGKVGLSGRSATFHPEPGSEGVFTFTFAAWDGSTNSNLGTVTITVGSPPPGTATSPSPSTNTPSATATGSTTTATATATSTPSTTAIASDTPNPSTTATATPHGTGTEPAIHTPSATRTQQASATSSATSSAAATLPASAWQVYLPFTLVGDDD